jgi:ABC-type glycerol-3-phosphate transport system substrate-binding protein
VAGGADIERLGLGPIVEAYEQLHPNVNIEYVVQPINDDTRRWIVTQQTAGAAPDIMWYQPDWAAEDYRRNWLIPIDDYLEQPNPYIAEGQPGSERWHDLFLPAIDVWRAADNKLYTFIGDQVQVGIYYNKDIFGQLGLSVPTTWEELMNTAQAIQDAGIVPFAEQGNDLDQLTWVSGWLTNFFYYPEIATYDTDGDGVLTKVEMAQAVVDGAYSFDQERNRARLEQLRRFAGYWQPGALGASEDQAVRLFTTGRAAMLVIGTWMYSVINEDPARTFDFDVFYFPVVDSTTSDLVPDGVPPTNKAAGYGTFQYVVTTAAEQRGVADEAFDFLMFATAPENLGPAITETGIALPAIRGAEPNPALASFYESVGYPAAPFQEDDSMFDFEFAQAFLAITSPYLMGDQSLDDTVSRLDAEMQAAAERVLGG